jgi:hypothetical protein
MCERLTLPLRGSAPGLGTPPATDDKQIRAHLKQFLFRKCGNDPDTIIIEELGLSHGYCRVDLAVVNGSLHGFEIKSDRDTFRRLARQADTYNKILDFITVVVGERHAEEALRVSPQWWGIQFAKSDRPDEVHLIQVREPVENPAPDKLAIAKLLWREEALTFLEELGAADGVRSRPRRFVYSRLAEVARIDAIRSFVRSRLRSRKDWRSDELQM